MSHAEEAMACSDDDVEETHEDTVRCVCVPFNAFIPNEVKVPGESSKVVVSTARPVEFSTLLGLALRHNFVTADTPSLHITERPFSTQNSRWACVESIA